MSLIRHNNINTLKNNTWWYLNLVKVYEKNPQTIIHDSIVSKNEQNNKYIIYAIHDTKNIKEISKAKTLT